MALPGFVNSPYRSGMKRSSRPCSFIMLKATSMWVRMPDIGFLPCVTMWDATAHAPPRGPDLLAWVSVLMRLL